MASPMPLLPPVTTAFDPSKPRSIDSPFDQCCLVNVRERFQRSVWAPRRARAGRSAEYVSRTSARSQSPVAHCRSVLAHTTPWIDCASVTGSMSWNTPCSQSALQLFDERLEHLGVGGLNQLGGGEHLRLRLRRQVAQIGFDVLVERQVEPPVDPGGDRLELRRLPTPSSVLSRRVSTRAMSRKTAATSWSFDSKCR